MSTDAFLTKAAKRKTKAKEIPESDIEGAFVKHAKRKGCLAAKLIFLSKRGFPDRTVLCPGGIIFFIEFKKKGQKLTPTQKPVRRKLESLGFLYYVCDEIGQGENILDKKLK